MLNNFPLHESSAPSPPPRHMQYWSLQQPLERVSMNVKFWQRALQSSGLWVGAAVLAAVLLTLGSELVTHSMVMLLQRQEDSQESIHTPDTPGDPGQKPFKHVDIVLV